MFWACTKFAAKSKANRNNLCFMVDEELVEFVVRLVNLLCKFSAKLKQYLFLIITTNVLHKIQVFNLEVFNLN